MVLPHHVSYRVHSLCMPKLTFSCPLVHSLQDHQSTLLLGHDQVLDCSVTFRPGPDAGLHRLSTLLLSAQ